MGLQLHSLQGGCSLAQLCFTKLFLCVSQGFGIQYYTDFSEGGWPAIGVTSEQATDRYLIFQSSKCCLLGLPGHRLLGQQPNSRARYLPWLCVPTVPSGTSSGASCTQAQELSRALKRLFVDLFPQGAGGGRER